MKKLLLTSCISIFLLSSANDLYGSLTFKPPAPRVVASSSAEQNTYEVLTSSSIVLKYMHRIPIIDSKLRINGESELSSRLIFKEFLLERPDEFFVFVSIKPDLLKKYPELEHYLSEVVQKPLYHEISIWQNITNNISLKTGKHYDSVIRLLSVINDQESTPDQLSKAVQELDKLSRNIFSCISEEPISRKLDIVSEDIRSVEDIPTLTLIPDTKVPNSYVPTILLTAFTPHELTLKELSLIEPYIPREIVKQMFCPDKDLMYFSALPVALPCELTEESKFFKIFHHVLYCMDLREYLKKEAILDWNIFRNIVLSTLIRNEKMLKEKITDPEVKTLLDAYLELPESKLIESRNIEPLLLGSHSLLCLERIADLKDQQRISKKLTSDTLTKLAATQKALDQHQTAIGQIKTQLHEEQSKTAKLSSSLAAESEKLVKIQAQFEAEKKKTKETAKLRREKQEADNKAKQAEDAKKRIQESLRRQKEQLQALQREYEAQQKASQKTIAELRTRVERLSQAEKEKEEIRIKFEQEKAASEEKDKRIAELQNQLEQEQKVSKEKNEQLAALQEQRNNDRETIAKQQAEIERLKKMLEEAQEKSSARSDSPASSYSSSVSTYSSPSFSSSSPEPTAAAPADPQPAAQQLQHLPPYSFSAAPSTRGKSRRLSPAPTGPHRTLNWRFENYYEG